MKEAFDRELKKKLEGLRPGEAGFTPAYDRIWERVQAGKKQPAVLPWRSWLSHAAAIAAGLVLGIFLLRPSEKPHPPTAVVSVADRQPAPAPAGPPIVIRDTLYVQVPARVTPPRRPATGTPVQTVPAPTLQQHIATVSPDTVPQALTKEPAQEALLATAKPAPLKVLHLSDIDNENAHPHSSRETMPAFFKRLINKGEGNNNSPETLSMLVSRHLSPSKNK